MLFNCFVFQGVIVYKIKMFPYNMITDSNIVLSNYE